MGKRRTSVAVPFIIITVARCLDILHNDDTFKRIDFLLSQE